MKGFYGKTPSPNPKGSYDFFLSWNNNDTTNQDNPNLDKLRNQKQI